MSTTQKTVLNKHINSVSRPATPRGRALYTIDCFLNGKPVLSRYDNPRLNLTHGEPCF